MYSTPACALAKSPKKICPKFFKMSGRKIFEDCIIWISYHWLLQWKSAEKFPFQIQLVLGQKVYLFHRRKNQNHFQYMQLLSPSYQAIEIWVAHRCSLCGEIQEWNTCNIKHNQIKHYWKKYLGLWENSIYAVQKRTFFFYLKINRNHLIHANELYLIYWVFIDKYFSSDKMLKKFVIGYDYM